jgi:hypothetical protein
VLRVHAEQVRLWDLMRIQHLTGELRHEAVPVLERVEQLQEGLHGEGQHVERGRMEEDAILRQDRREHADHVIDVQRAEEQVEVLIRLRRAAHAAELRGAHRSVDAKPHRSVTRNRQRDLEAQCTEVVFQLDTRMAMLSTRYATGAGQLEQLLGDRAEHFELRVVGDENHAVGCVDLRVKARNALRMNGRRRARR